MQDCCDLLKACWLKITDFLRALCPTLRKNWPFFLLAIYALASLIYQASAFWREQTLGTGRVDYRVISAQYPAEEYQLAIRYPTTIPLEVAGERGRPLVAWLWQIPLTATTTISTSTSSIISPATISPSSQTPLSTSLSTTTTAIAFTTNISTPASIPTATGFSTSTELTTSTPITWRLIITVVDENTTSAVSQTNLVFTDKDGLEIASILDLQPGLREPEAPRGILYISRLTNGRGNSRARLDFQLWRGDSYFKLTPILDDSPVIVKLETRLAAFWRKLCGLILNTPALTWVSILTIGANLWVKRREKRAAAAKELRDQIQALKDMSVRQAWETYWDLYRANHDRQELKRAWREIEILNPFETSKVIREWLTDYIQQNGPLQDVWDDITEAQSSLNKEEVEALSVFFGSKSSET